MQLALSVLSLVILSILWMTEILMFLLRTYFLSELPPATKPKNDQSRLCQLIIRKHEHGHQQHRSPWALRQTAAERTKLPNIETSEFRLMPWELFIVVWAICKAKWVIAGVYLKYTSILIYTYIYRLI